LTDRVRTASAVTTKCTERTARLLKRKATVGVSCCFPDESPDSGTDLHFGRLELTRSDMDPSLHAVDAIPTGSRRPLAEENQRQT